MTFFGMTGISLKNELAVFFSSYAVGYVMSIVLYIILLMSGLQRFSLLFSVFYSVIWILLLILSKKVPSFDEHSSRFDRWLAFCSLLGALLIAVMIYFLPNRSATLIGYRNMNGDLTYWFKNCVAATKGYPLPELSVDGLHLYWHLFSCFEVAFIHFVTGIEIYNLCFTFAYVWKMILLVGGGYILASFFLKKRSHMLLVMLVILFTSGLDGKTSAFYQYHLFRCSLAFEEGYALSMFDIVFFMKFMEMKKKNIPAYVLTVLGFVGALGLKVSGGTVLLAGIFGRTLASIKKNWKNVMKAVILFASYCLLYLIISKLFIIDGNALTNTTSSHRMVFEPTGTLRRVGYGQIFDTLRTGFLGKLGAYAVTVFAYLLDCEWAAMIPLVLGFVVLLAASKWKEVVSKEVLPLILMVLCGCGIDVLFNHPGLSQVYFLFNSVAFTSVLGFVFLEKTDGRVRYADKVMGITASVLVFLSIRYNYQNWQTIYLISSDAYVNNTVAGTSGENDVSSSEIEGLRWIRDNLPEDAVLATNKVLFDNPEETQFSRNFTTSGYSERQVYLEGFSSTNLPGMEFVMNRLSQLRNYYNGEDGAADVLKENGVHYAVVFKAGQDNSVELEGKNIYENNDLKVMDLGED